MQCHVVSTWRPPPFPTLSHTHTRTLGGHHMSRWRSLSHTTSTSPCCSTSGRWPFSAPPNVPYFKRTHMLDCICIMGQALHDFVSPQCTNIQIKFPSVDCVIPVCCAASALTSFLSSTGDVTEHGISLHVHSGNTPTFRHGFVYCCRQCSRGIKLRRLAAAHPTLNQGRGQAAGAKYCAHGVNKGVNKRPHVPQ